MLIIISLLLFKLVDTCRTKKNTDDLIKMKKTKDARQQSIADYDHGSPEFTEHMIKLHLDRNSDTSERKKQTIMFMETEQKNHQSEAEVILCVRNKIDDPVIYKNILETYKPSITQRLTPEKIEKCLAEVKKMSLVIVVFDILDRVKTITFYYLDLLKDILLCVRLLLLVGVAYVFYYPTAFPSQVIFISLTAAFLPIILSALIVSSDPLIVTGFHYSKKLRNLTGWKLILSKFSAFLFFPFIPALLFEVKHREKNNLEKLILNNDHADPEIKAEIKERRKFILAVKRKILTLKRLELSIEIIPQVSILTLMILLKNSETNLETGLEAVFDVEPTFGVSVETFIILNILWSMKTGVFTALKVKKDGLGFIPATGSCLLLLRNSLTLITRITSIVMFFIPFLGCLNLATHWKAEKIKFGQYKGQFPNFKYEDVNPVEKIRFPDNKLTFYYEGKTQSVDWLEIFRSNSQEVKITDYTLIKLSTAYGIFWGIMLLQIVAVALFQVLYHRSFTFSGVLHQILHAVEHVHIFDTSADWAEEEENSREKHKNNTSIEVKTSDNETTKFPGQENIQVKEMENSQEKQQNNTGIEVKTSDNETTKSPGQENIQVKDMENSLITKEERNTLENEEEKPLLEVAENTQIIEEEKPLNEKEENILDNKKERKSLNQEEEKTKVKNGENAQENEKSFTVKEEKNTLDKDEGNSLTNEIVESKKKEEGRFLIKEDKLGLEKKKEKDKATSFNMEGSKSFYYKQRWGRAKLELFVGSLLHWIINLLLLCPIICIGKVDQLNNPIIITSD